MKTRHLILGVVVLLGTFAIVAFFYVRAMRPTLELGVGYAARVACGCRYLEGRPLAQCHDDFEEGMEAIRLSEDVAGKAVTAWVPLIASRTVRYDPVLGCKVEPFTGQRLTVR